MYMLSQEPTGELAEAFDVLDEIFGVEEFSESGALGALAEAFDNEASSFWSRLKRGSYVQEV